MAISFLYPIAFVATHQTIGVVETSLIFYIFEMGVYRG